MHLMSIYFDRHAKSGHTETRPPVGSRSGVSARGRTVITFLCLHLRLSHWRSLGSEPRLNMARATRYPEARHGRAGPLSPHPLADDGLHPENLDSETLRRPDELTGGLVGLITSTKPFALCESRVALVPA
jgi:hypothetical protein